MTDWISETWSQEVDLEMPTECFGLKHKLLVI